MKRVTKLRMLKNDVIVFNYRYSNADRNGNSYQNFGECYIIRNSKRIYFTPLSKYTPLSIYGRNLKTDSTQEVKEQMLLLFNISIRWISDFPNIVVAQSNVKYSQL